ncbi:MAG: hypothetical protein R2862_02020 [Thermoanaerobaculia bacterium]
MVEIRIARQHLPHPLQCPLPSEGVDVPALDAVLFSNPTQQRRADVVQSVTASCDGPRASATVGIILPIGIPADKTPEEALKNNQKYKVVWQVLQALRAHDIGTHQERIDRFNATINQLGTKQEASRQHPGHRRRRGGPGDNAHLETDGDGRPHLRNVRASLPSPT